MVEDNGANDGLASDLVDEEERLLRELRASLDTQSVGVVPHKGAVDDEVATIKEGVEVTQNIQVSMPSLVPASDGFVDGDSQPAHATVVAHGVAMMEANDEVGPHLDVGVVALGDEETNTGLVLELLREAVVEETLQAVTGLGAHTTLRGHATMVSAVTRNDNLLQVRVLQQVADATCQVSLHLDDGIDGEQAVTLHELLVDGATDEVAQKGKDQSLDLDVLLLLEHELEPMLEEALDTFGADLLVEVVEVVDLPLMNDLLDVPVTGHDHRHSFVLGALVVRDLVVAVMDLKGLGSGCLSFELRHSLGEFTGATTLTTQLLLVLETINQLFGGLRLEARQSEFQLVAPDGTESDSQGFGELVRSSLAPMLLDVGKTFGLAHVFLLRELRSLRRSVYVHLSPGVITRRMYSTASSTVKFSMS